MTSKSTRRRIAIAACSVLIFATAASACDDDKKNDKNDQEQDDKDVTDVLDSVVPGDTTP